ncbi:cyclic AMP receptor-like protein A isoform X2 [Limulus polyphemus]|uniref:Cyclic AMP receptor-like protein A isoform X2 n=1 Tax=Limulus polyphemus TaxID=6850 RepID=A0ABM1SX11_LIMPO|nr:cyclic AMP receptor-like protein A isoform X2 [Limulus polyphemus]
MSTDSSPGCTLFGGHQQKCEIILGVRYTSATLSIIGCLFIVGVIWLFKKYEVFAQRLILYLSMAAFLSSVGYLFAGNYPQSPSCKFEAFWLTYFEWVVLLWVCCITVNLLFNGILTRRTDHFECYGYAGAWCWIQPQFPYWRFGIWYGPLFVIIGLLFVCYLYLTIHLRRKVKSWEGLYNPELERTKEVLRQQIRPLQWYPLIYLSLSVFPLIHRIQNAISHENVFGLMLLHILFAPLPGTVNAIVFTLDRETTSRLSWIQVKRAFLSHFTKQTIIGEYPAEVHSPISTSNSQPIIDMEITSEQTDLDVHVSQV